MKNMLLTTKATSAMTGAVRLLEKPSDSERRLVFRGQLSDFYHCVEQGQLALALKSLEDAGRLTAAPKNYWSMLSRCAGQLGMNSEQAHYRKMASAQCDSSS